MPRLSLPTLTVLLALLALSGCDGFSPAAEEPGPVISAAPAPSKAMIGPGSCEGDGPGDDDGGGDGGSSYDGPVYGGGGGDEPDDPLLAGVGGGVAPPDAQVASCDSGGGGGYTGGGGSTGDGGDDSGETAEQAAWGKALKIGRRIKTAVDRGEDLSDVNTWKRIANDEWGDLVDCGMGIHSVAQGDMLGLVDVLNCASSQLLGVDFGDMLYGLRLADRLGFGPYDEILEAILRSPLARAFIELVDNPALLYDIGRHFPADFDVPYGLPGSSSKIADNLWKQWGQPTRVPIPNKPSGSYRFSGAPGSAHENYWFTRYPSSSRPGEWTIRIQYPDGSFVKVRLTDA